MGRQCVFGLLKGAELNVMRVDENGHVALRADDGSRV